MYIRTIEKGHSPLYWVHYCLPPLCWKAFSENITPHQQHWANSFQKSPSNHLFLIGWQLLKCCMMLIVTSFEIQRKVRAGDEYDDNERRPEEGQSTLTETSARQNLSFTRWNQRTQPFSWKTWLHFHISIFVFRVKQRLTSYSASEVANQSGTSGCLVTSGRCWPSAADEEWYSPKRPSSTVAINSSGLNAKVSALLCPLWDQIAARTTKVDVSCT